MLIPMLRWPTIALVATLTGLMSVSDLAAQAKGKAQPTQAATLDETLHLLLSVQKSLEMADHDYGGHRADAVREIGAAAKELKHSHPKGTTAGAKEPSKGKTPASKNKENPSPHAEPQALSDKQLANAVPQLKLALAHLQNPMAAAKLNAAIHQLETALQYSKAKNKAKS